MKIRFQFFVICLFLSACSPLNDVKRQDQVSDYSKVLKQDKALGLDVRSVGEFKQNGSDLALNIPISELPNRVNELDENKTIFVFCESGGRSMIAKELLQMKGFKKVINIKDWRTWNEIVKVGI